MKREKPYIGSIFLRKGSNRLYLRIPPRVAHLVGLPEQVATGLPDTLKGRREAEQILTEVTRKWLNLRGLPIPAQTVRMTIAEAFERFMSEYAPQRSEKTRRLYDIGYRAVMQFGSEQAQIGMLVAKGRREVCVLEPMMERLIQTRQGIDGEITPTSVRKYLAGIATFANWCVEEGLMTTPVNMKRLLRLMPSISGKPIRTYSEHEVMLMIQTGRQARLKKHRRVADLIDILWRTPLRLHEALWLRLGDIDRASMNLIVERKDGKAMEYVPLRQEDVVLLDEIARRWNATRPDDRILGLRAHNDTHLRKYLYELMDLAGVERQKRSYHEFKKTYITRLVRRVGKDLSLFEVSRLARCGIDVLEKHYLRLSTDDLRQKIHYIQDDHVREHRERSVSGHADTNAGT